MPSKDSGFHKHKRLKSQQILKKKKSIYMTPSQLEDVKIPFLGNNLELKKISLKNMNRKQTTSKTNKKCILDVTIAIHQAKETKHFRLILSLFKGIRKSIN